MPTLNLVAAALVLFATSAFADWTKLSSPSFKMIDPPEEGSSAYEKDFELLHRYQDQRTKADCEEARGQLSHTFQNFFGSELTEAQLAKYDELLTEVFQVTARIGSYFKEKWERPRPYVTDDTLRPCIPKPGAGRSYPSTHAALGMVGGCLMAKALPKKAKQLEFHGKRIGDLRMIAGVHHPTDVKAGQKLGREICERLLEDESFLEALRQ